jgi:uncharacterized protein (TIGR00255 family)
MTGYGRAEVPCEGGRLGAEVRAVNARHLELRARLPRELAPLETAVRAAASRHFARGQVEVSLRLPAGLGGGADVAVNVAAARAYRDAVARLRAELGVGGELSAAELLALPGVVQLAEAASDPRALESVVLAAVEAACRDADAMRAREGEALARDLHARVARIERVVAGLEAQAEAVSRGLRERLRRRLEKLAPELELDPARFEQEVVYHVDKSDVTEEIVRLRAHLEAFRAALAGEGAVGRRLEFLLQELGREANTLGSKAAEAALAAQAVEIKTELERIREQVQNVE